MPISDDEWKAMSAKVDALISSVEALKPKEDTKPPANPLQPLIDKGTIFMRTYLKDKLPKEKLDTLSYDELLLAADLASTLKPTVPLNAPPIGKSDTATPKTDTRPAYLIPDVNVKPEVDTT